jgi:hypothetical protein
VYFPPLPANVDYILAGITGAVAEVVLDMLCCAWEEVRYRKDICCATSGSHMELNSDMSDET